MNKVYVFLLVAVAVLGFSGYRLSAQEISLEPEIPKSFETAREIRRKIDEVPILRTELILSNEYRVFLTAYCAEECGWSYATSSGAECHRSSDSDRYEPTTCAVDLRYFSYGELFYVPSEDRVYIAEDTGAFYGMWLDLYQSDMADVRYFNTRYETVYTCELRQYEVPISVYDVRPTVK